VVDDNKVLACVCVCPNVCVCVCVVMMVVVVVMVVAVVGGDGGRDDDGGGLVVGGGWSEGLRNCLTYRQVHPRCSLLPLLRISPRHNRWRTRLRHPECR
jgi:hypothetical protein